MRTFKDLVSFARSGATQGIIDGVVWRRRFVKPREAVVSTDGASWLVYDLLTDPIVQDIVRQRTEETRRSKKPTKTPGRDGQGEHRAAGRIEKRPATRAHPAEGAGAEARRRTA